MPTKRCCCGKCPDGYCIAVGTAQGCAVESATEYRAVRSGQYINGGAEDECATEMFDYVASFEEVPMEQPGTPPTGCCWISEYLEPFPTVKYSMELCIIDESNATLTLTIVGTPDYTVVWKSGAGYDPLCTSKFFYSAEDSSPPPDCSWPGEMCVEPLVGCCPDVSSADWPTTLYVTLDIVSGDCACGDGPQATNTITWDASDASWKGVVDFGDCGTKLDIKLFCAEIPSNPDLLRREFEFDLQLFFDPPTTGSPGCVSDNLGVSDPNPTDTCVPFILTTYAEGSGFCCPSGDIVPFVVTISE